jgi:TetR/AcrR family transcriptional regulator, regulator of autoinduction and epiphytic fitness
VTADQSESHPSRRYSSQVRDEQARRTRQAVVTAARELFLAQGYAATTIDAVADAAHVSRRTVFNSVGGKSVLLKLAFDWAIVGDDEPVALADRPEVKAVRAEQDPHRALLGWAELVAAVAGRVAPIIEVAAVAADADPAAAELLADYARSRMSGATEFTQHLASLGDGLAPGVTEQEAADLCWALMDGHLYRRLVTDRGWTTAQFTQWLYQSMAAVLLRPAPRTAGQDDPARASEP